MSESIITLGIGASPDLAWFITSGLYTGGVTPPPAAASRYFGHVVQVLLADKNGRIVAEVEPLVGPVSWRRNNVGKVILTESRRSPKLNEGFWEFGNRVLIQFDNGLPAWGGVIDLPRTWEPDVVPINVYSAEHLLNSRQTVKSRVFTQATVGNILIALLTEANALSYTGIDIGEVWSGGALYNEEYHFNPLLKVIYDRLVGRLSTADFFITAREEAGYIRFTANLLERRGLDKPGIALLEGHNAVDVRLMEQGTIINSWDVAGADTRGAGSGWGNSRLTTHSDDAASMSRYGLRESSQIRNDSKDIATLMSETDILLQSSLTPKTSLACGALNVAPATFGDYDLGDTMTAEFPTFAFGGFAGMVQINGREFDPQSGVCKLEVEAL